MKAVSIVLFAVMFGCAIVKTVAAAPAATFEEKVLWSFGSGTDGQEPATALIDVNSTFYATTGGGGVYGDGTAFALDPNTGAEKVLYSFCIRGEYCLDGAFPSGGLIDVKGKLYGTTLYGGANWQGGGGTVFSLDPNTGKEKVLYSFCQEQNCADGRNPVASLSDVKGMLYGTTQGGGAAGAGTAFVLDTKKGTETVLYSFCKRGNCADGFNPIGMIDVNGTLYGTTIQGGSYKCGDGQGCGTVFSLDPNSGAETVLHSFGNGTDGGYPGAGLTAVNGMLNGTTSGGGISGCGGPGCGTVFSIDPATGAEQVIYSFCSQQNCADGANPNATLIDVLGTLYGTTDTGGGTGCDGAGCGTVSSMDLATGAEAVRYSFNGSPSDGQGPNGVIDVNGSLYGTTDTGGTYGDGTVFVLEKTHSIAHP